MDVVGAGGGGGAGGGCVAQWLVRRNSNPMTPEFDPLAGAGCRAFFSSTPSELLCRLACACPPFVCTARTQHCAHVQDPKSTCRNIE